jgi:hypothetical protein
MPTYELNLSALKFPKDLDNNKANFRVAVDLRYIGIDGALGTIQAVLPGLDTYWECDRNKQNVRGADEGKWGTVDFSKVDAWDKLIFALPASKLHSIQFKIFDVNRSDGWDKIKNTLSSVIHGLLEEVKNVIPGAFGTATDDVKSFLLKKWAGGDSILYKCSLQFPNLPIGTHKISGHYEIQFTVEEKAFEV